MSRSFDLVATGSKVVVLEAPRTSLRNLSYTAFGSGGGGAGELVPTTVGGGRGAS